MPNPSTIPIPWSLPSDYLVFDCLGLRYLTKKGKGMFRLIKLKQCCHVYDTEQNCFVRSSAKNLHKSLRSASLNQTRREMLSNSSWHLCQDPHCKVRQCKSKHYIANCNWSRLQTQVSVWKLKAPPKLEGLSWCRRWESNPHTRGYTILSRARLPVPPLRQV